MADYHTYYKGIPGETTQWEDIQRKLGNLPPKEPVWRPEKYAPEEEQAKDESFIDQHTGEQLEELEDEFTDDRMLEKYRQQRIEEMAKAARRPRFGTVELLRGSEFVQKVSNAGDGVWVVVHLFKDGNTKCGLLAPCLDELAAKYPSTKFLKIISTDCIPKYPDANLPTLLVYKEGQCKQTLVGLQQFGGARTTPEQVAMVLNVHGPICAQPDEDEQEAAQTQVRQLVDRLVQQRVGGVGQERNPDDESSEFDD